MMDISPPERELLRGIRKRPGMYIGEYSLPRLRSFLDGYHGALVLHGLDGSFCILPGTACPVLWAGVWRFWKTYPTERRLSRPSSPCWTNFWRQTALSPYSHSPRTRIFLMEAFLCT